MSCELAVFIAGYCVLCWFNSEFRNKITYKTDENTNIFVILLVFCDFNDFVCQLTVKTTEHTVASYENSDFTWKFLLCGTTIKFLRAQAKRYKKLNPFYYSESNTDVIGNLT
jgi:hypothetical protein